MKKGFLHIALSSFGLRVMAAVAGYVSVLFLGRWLGAEDFGRLATVLSSVLFVMTIVAMGVPMGFLRTIGELQATDRSELLRKLIYRASRFPLRLALALAILGAGYCLVVVWFDAEAGVAGRPLALLASLMLLPFYLMAELNAAILRSFGQIALALGPRDVLWRIALLPIGYGVAAIFAPGKQFFPLLLISVGVLGVLVAFQQTRITKALNAEIATMNQSHSSADTELWTQTRPVMRQFWATNVAAMGLSNLDVIAISVFISEESAGPYFLASRTAALVSFTLNAIGVAIGPRLSAAHYAGDTERLRSDLALGALLSFVPAVLGLLILILFGKTILGLAGDAVVPFYPILIILATGHFFRGVTGACGHLLNMTGHETLSARISISAFCCAFVAIGVGGYTYGVMGVAVGLAAIMIVTDLSVYVASRMVTDYEATLIGVFGILKRS